MPLDHNHNEDDYEYLIGEEVAFMVGAKMVNKGTIIRIDPFIRGGHTIQEAVTDKGFRINCRKFDGI